MLSLDCSTREKFLVTNGKQLEQTRCQVVSGRIIHIEKVHFDTVGPRPKKNNCWFPIADRPLPMFATH